MRLRVDRSHPNAWFNFYFAERKTLAGGRKSPCVGICSTTYGDLVCRGCKRFAHEITSWNGYEQAQRDQIWSRLNDIQAQVVDAHLTIYAPETFAAYQIEHLTRDHGSEPEVVHRVLTHLAASGRHLDDAGLVSTLEGKDALAVIRNLDQEMYSRSQAIYERSFRVTS